MMIILKNIDNTTLFIFKRALELWTKILKHNLDGYRLDKELRPKIQYEYEMTKEMYKDFKEMYEAEEIKSRRMRPKKKRR